MFLTGECSAAKFSLLCTTQYSSRAPYMKSLDKHMEPNQALWAWQEGWRCGCLGGCLHGEAGETEREKRVEEGRRRGGTR